MDKSKWEYRNFEKCIEKIPHPKQLKTSEYNSEGRYPIISQEETLISGYSDKQDIVNHFSKPVVIFGDHTRTLKYIDFDFIVGADGVKILIPKDDLIGKFLFYYLKWYKIPSLGYSRHYKLLKEISVPIPPILIQQDIVSELDQLSDIISLKQQQVKEYYALIESVFYDMFGESIRENKLQIKTIDELATDVKYGTSKAGGTEGIFKYLRMNNLTNDGYLDLNDIKYIDLSDEEVEKYVVRKGDVLFNRTNSRERVGKTALFDQEEEMVIAGYIIRVRLNNEISPVYLVRYMNLPYMKKVLRKLAKGAVGQANINAQQMKSIEVPLPPLSLQRSFAEKVKAIEHQKSLLKQSIAKTQTLLDSRMQEYFG